MRQVCTIESQYFNTCSTAFACPAPRSGHPMSGLSCKSHSFVSLLLQPQGERLTVSHGVIQAFRFQRMASPSLSLGDLLKSITLQQPVNKRVIQSLTYHYTEFVIQICLQTMVTGKFFDKLDITYIRVICVSFSNAFFFFSRSCC